MTKEDIPEIKSLLLDYKSKRSKAKSASNKYKKQLAKFYFLDIIIKPRSGTQANTEGRKEDHQLEVAISDLFNSIGIKSYVPSNKDNFDVISEYKKDVFGIEVKNGNLPTENEMFQALKYGQRYGMHRILIYNNARTNQNFDENRIKDAELNSYGILTTSELHKGYMKLKTNKMSFNTFYSQLQKTGLIKYSGKAFRRPINSEASR